MANSDITRKCKHLAILLRHDKEAFEDGKIGKHGWLNPSTREASYQAPDFMSISPQTKKPPSTSVHGTAARCHHNWQSENLRRWLQVFPLQQWGMANWASIARVFRRMSVKELKHLGLRGFFFVQVRQWQLWLLPGSYHLLFPLWFGASYWEHITIDFWHYCWKSVVLWFYYQSWKDDEFNL